MPSRPVISAVFLTVAVALVLTAGYRARALRRGPRPPDVVALVLLLAALAASFVVQAPAARALLNPVRVNVGQLLGNGLTLVAACAGTAMVVFILYEPVDAGRRLRPRIAALAVAIVAMTALFLANPAEPEGFTGPASSAGIIAYYLIYLVYLSATLIDLLLLIRCRARGEPDPWVRAGMQMVAGACAVALLYTAGRMANLTVDYAGVDVQGLGRQTYGLLEFVVAAVLPAVSVLLAVAGFTLRRWAPPVLRPLTAFSRMRRHRAAHARLQPLWESVHDVLPRVSLPDRDRRSRPSLRLYGRIVEICDAEMLARPLLSPDRRQAAFEEARARGLSPEESEAIADAVVLRAGLGALAERREPDPAGAGDRMADRPRIEGIDLDGEAARLGRVADAYQHSPLVRDMAARATPGHDRTGSTTREM